MKVDIVNFISCNRASLDVIIDLVPIPVFIKDRDGRYIDCNVAFKDFLSFSRDQVIGKTAYEIWSQDEADVFFAQDEDLFKSGSSQIYESKITSSKGVTHIVQFHKQIFTDKDGAPAGFLGVIFDITEKKSLERSLTRLATTDPLTGLPNRRDGMDRLAILHQEGERKQQPYCLAMLDIDHFKKLNDQYGHAQGDRVLSEFSRLVRETLRSRDVCFRYGGEEFVVLLPETTLDVGFGVMERLRKKWAAAEISAMANHKIQSTVSIGIASFPLHSRSADNLIQLCDQALYEAKNLGRNCAVSA